MQRQLSYVALSLQALQAGGNVKKASELLLQAASSLENFKVSFQAQLNDLLPSTPAMPGYDLTNVQTSLLGNLQSRGQQRIIAMLGSYMQARSWLSCCM